MLWTGLPERCGGCWPRGRWYAWQVSEARCTGRGLFTAEGAPVWGGRWPPIPIYPEYFALPLLCQKKKAHQGIFLPFWSYGVQAGYALVLDLVLGRAVSSDYQGLELPRAWALGYFSRLDALLLLLWLTAALWRICLLAYLLRALWPTCIGMKKNPEI